MSRQRKKPTKKQLINEIIPNHINKTLKDNFINNMIIGRETTLQDILDKINNGSTLEELKDYIELSLSPKSKEALENVTLGVDKSEEV